jgi:hypothetical protein
MAEKENPTASPDDRVAAIRGLTPIDATMLPATPKPFQALTGDDQGGLRKVAKEDEAEIQQALAQIAGRGAELKNDLGKNAPDPERAAALVERLKANRAARTKLASLLSYVEDSNAVALHDAVLLVNEVKLLLEPNLKRDATLEETYSEVLEYSELVGQKISEGRARKRKEREQK